MTDKIRQIAAIKELAQCDHEFISPEGVKEFTEPFGFVGSTYIAHANPHEIKGLTLKDGVKKAEGQDADRIAEQICRHLKLPCAPMPMMGRGSRLRVCCAAILQHLGEPA